MIINDDRLFEIIHFLCCNNQNYILCHPYISKSFELGYNSLEVEKEPDFDKSCLLLIETLKKKKTYEKITLHDRSFIIADTLDVYNNF